VRSRRTVGRYSLFDELASGGAARVHLGRLDGVAGFSRLVAIKRLREGMIDDPEAVRLFLEEARLAARIRHPNVVQTLDVMVVDEELFIVMDYVHGETLARLLSSVRRRQEQVPMPVLGTIMSAVLEGLHAAHETVDERGEPLGIVHRDVSPQNIMVGVDGVARVLDFGIAKANTSGERTREGYFRGKLSYAAPEQLESKRVSRAVDIYAAGVVLWEATAGRRLFAGGPQPELLGQILLSQIQPPSSANPSLPSAIDEVVMRALSRDPAARFPTALAMAKAVEAAFGVSPAREVGAWVGAEAQAELGRRAELVTDVERAEAPPASSVPRPASHPMTLPRMPAPSDFDDREAFGAGSQATMFANVSHTKTTGLTMLSTGVPPRRYKGPLLFAGVGLLAALGGVARLVTRVPAPPPAAAEQGAAAVPAAVPVPVLAPVAPSGAATPGHEASASADPNASASASASAKPAATAVRPPPPAWASRGKPPPPRPPANRPAEAEPAATPTPAPPPPPSTNARCSPPYTVDADGMRRYKPECL
jgi:serine/threonine-protein kinase